jgi:hypothetical protein
MRKCRKKEVMGVALTSPDGTIWNWQIDGNDYAWCPAGQLLHRMPGGQTRLIMFSHKVEGAVGYTMGWADCSAWAKRKELEGSSR